MAHKRNAQEAFGKPQGQLSAFAVAKLARESGQSCPTPISQPGSEPGSTTFAAAFATVPYDGHHSGTTTPRAASIEKEVIVTPSSRRPAIQLSSFKPNEQNVLNNEGQNLEIRLQLDETATFTGEYDVIVLTGVVTIYGHVLRPNSSNQRVFALTTQALPQVQARQENTVIRISSIRSSLQRLERFSPLFRNTWASNATDARSFVLLGTSEDDGLHRSLSALEIDREMETISRTLAAKAIEAPKGLRILAIGAKSSGKSTFNRILCNHLFSWIQVSKCQYLDLDPGQPEFGPPGQLSLVEIKAPLFGPPLTHPASSYSSNFRLIRSHTIAATSFKDDPEFYEACALDLIRYADRHCPVIINSCGWVSGFGATVLEDLVVLLDATEVVFLEPLEDTLIESIEQKSEHISFHRISRRAPKASSRSPAESRAMLTMAYFHHRPGVLDALRTWSGNAISSIRPWIVSYAGANPGILAIASYGQSPDPKFLAEVLDGSVVAMVVLDEAAAKWRIFNAKWNRTKEDDIPDLTASIDRTPEDIPYVRPNLQGINCTINPRISHCVCLALIRSIDTERKQLHLVIPLPENRIAQLMDQQVILVRGSFDPPDWAYLEDVYKHGDRSVAEFGETDRPWVSKREMVGIESAVWRLRHPPLPAAVAANR